MANEAIKAAAKNAGVKLWEIADYFGVADCAFSRQLRHEFPEEKRRRTLEAIGTIAGRKEGSCHENG